MSNADLVVESLRLMGIGMGIVFCFLLLLVAILRLMSWAAGRISPALPEPELILPPDTGSGPPIAVITAAIARYRAARHGGSDR
jgi:oxaloacetate decarboxylase gamma subunit